MNQENKPPKSDVTSAHQFKKVVKQLSFTLIIVFIFFAGLELLLALFNVRPIVSTEDPLVGFSGNIPLFVETTQTDGTVMMRTAENKLEWFNDQSFPKIKGKNSYRVFCLGESTTFGHPYKDSTSFCGWLRVFLKTVDPSRNWEVINAGGISYASYRVARLMNELAQYQPDLFIIYLGQNEFLEQRSYGDLKKLPDWLLYTYSLLSNTRTYTAVKDVVDAIKPDTSKKGARQKTQLSSEVDEVLRHTPGPTSYHRDDIQKQKIVEHYRLNFARMIQIARRADAGVILVNPAVNLKDMSPFKSEHKTGLTNEQLAKWDALYQQGHEDYFQDRYKEALDLYRQALTIDDRYAELYFRMGKAQFALADFDAAEKSFWRAIDEDVAPLRILSEMRNVVADVAKRNNVPLIDFQDIIKDAYRKKYNHTIFGKEYFLDHVHPTIDGYRLLGEALFDQLARQGVTSPSAILSEEKISQITATVYSKLNKGDQRAALITLGRLFDWAGKFDEAHALFSTSLDMFGPHAITYGLMGKSSNRAGKIDQAIEYTRKSLSMNPEVEWVQALMGTLLKEKGETDKAIQHYLVAIRLDPNQAETHEELAMLLASKGDFDGAGHHFSEAMRINPGDDATILNFTVFLVKAGREDEAMTWAQKLLQKNKYQAEVHNIMGVLLAKQGRFDQATGHFAEAVRINPDFPSAKENLAKAEAAAKHDPKNIRDGAK
jgi:tetratricopeptide (TPR) repeat protein